MKDCNGIALWHLDCAIKDVGVGKQCIKKKKKNEILYFWAKSSNFLAVVITFD